MILILLIGLLFIYNQIQFKKGEEAFPPIGKFVTVDNCKLHYIEEGKGQPVVFLHGGMLSCKDFVEVVQLVAKQGYHAIAFDRPGYGYSERPKGVEVTPSFQARLIYRALRELGVDQPIILVGHSWSGTMTLSYAIQFPKEVAGIVTVGGAMYKEGYPAENGDLLSKIVTAPIIGNFILNTLLKTPLAKGVANSMVKATFAPEQVPEKYAEELYALGFRPGHFKANREDVLAFPYSSKQLSEKYKTITIPTVIVVGEKDPFGTIEQAERLKNDIPHALYKKIPNIGHMIPILHPQTLLDNINELSRMNKKTI